MEEVEELKQSDEKNNELLVKLESETELVRQKLAASEQQAELASATAQQKYTLLSKAFQRLQSINANLLQRCRYAHIEINVKMGQFSSVLYTCEE
jgi:hypothetical protein